MDCQQVKERLFSYLDGELTEDAKMLEDHLAQCLPCYKRATLEKAFLKVIKARAGGRPVPPSLESRIRDEISKRGSQRDRGIHPLWGLAAAAVLVTAVGFTLIPRDSEDPAYRNPRGESTVLASPAAYRSAETASAQPVKLSGTLVCIGCTVACSPGKVTEHKHRNGIRTADGRIWHILETNRGLSLINDQSHLGDRVTVEGTVYAPAQAVSVNQYSY